MVTLAMFKPVASIDGMSGGRGSARDSSSCSCSHHACKQVVLFLTRFKQASSKQAFKQARRSVHDFKEALKAGPVDPKLAIILLHNQLQGHGQTVQNRRTFLAASRS